MLRNQSLSSHFLKAICLIFILFCFIGTSFSQQETVQIDSDYEIMYCSVNNGVHQPTQEIQLFLRGPNYKKWFFSFSVNDSPAKVVSVKKDLDFSKFKLSLFLRNTSKYTKNYTIELKKAWYEDLSPIHIPDKYKRATIQILPLAMPEVIDYYPKAKINSTKKYSAIIGKNSTYSVWASKGANILEHKSKIVNKRQTVNIKIKWPKEASANYFKLIETDAYGCNSDTIFAGLEIVKSFTVDLGEDKNLCEGTSVVLSPTIDLPSQYSYKWSTRETSKEITIDKPGTYHLTVKDQTDNQEVKTSIDVLERKSPNIPLQDYIEVNDADPVIDIYKEGLTYEWSDGTKESSFKVARSGTYSVSVESTSGCKSTKEFKAKMKSEIFTIDLPEVIHMCGKEKMNLQPKLSIDQNYRFEWNDMSTAPALTIEKSGDYWVKITDPDGYQKTAATKVIYHPNPIVDLGADITIWDGETVTLDAENSGASFTWNTDETTQQIEVNSGGVYIVQVSDEFGCSNKDTMIVTHRKGERFGVSLGENQTICEGDSVLITPSIEGNPAHPLEFKWLGLSHTNPNIYLKDEGSFCLEVTDANGYTESDCIEITLLPTPKVNLGHDLISHPEKKIVLDAGTPNCYYQWSTNEITQKITVDTEGEYWVKVTTELNCTASDTIEVSYLEDYPFVGLPKAFSPNGDTHNDELFVIGKDVKDITLMIFNRLGQKLFETKDINKGWNGFYNGQLQDIDSYVYILYVTFLDGRKTTKKGSVALLR